MLTIRIFVAALLIVGAGLVDGAWTNRWRPAPELAALTAKFDSIPVVIGDWQGTAFELPAQERAMAVPKPALSESIPMPAREFP